MEDDRLVFDGVGKIFPGGVTALDSVSFRVGASEFVSVIGPSGCGKSTLLKLASGLMEPSSGTITASESAAIGYVFQEPTLLPWRTVRANVELLAELRGVPRGERRQTATWALSLVGLSEFENRYPRQLSAGMQMRASLARSLTLKPRTFLFDEPFGSLDEITRERLNDELIKLYVSQRFAGLFVTHSVFEAAFLGSRVVVLSSRPGRIVEQVIVPFDYPRSPNLRYDPSFTEIVRRVKEALRRGGV